jgi:site-specific DNA-cytosine methylase
MSTTPSYVELCAGLGGSRVGFDEAGWDCKLAVELDPRIAASHRASFGECLAQDVRSLDANSVPVADLLVAGFPCQPFSTSGVKTGFAHNSGNVFEAIANIIETRRPPFLLFENVQGLLLNQTGYSMARILARLCELNYLVEWASIDAVRCGAPQTRRRVFIAAIGREHADGVASPWIDVQGMPMRPFFGRLLSSIGISSGKPRELSLKKVLMEREPRIGIARSATATPFGGWGVAVDDRVITGKAEYEIPEYADQLGKICCPKFPAGHLVRSVRYYARGGPTLPHFRKEAVAHCLGTNIGAAPTFAIPLGALHSKVDRDYVLEFSNWSRDQAGHLVFRLTPERALRLFGKGALRLEKALHDAEIGVTEKYIWLGNLVAPGVATFVANSIKELVADLDSDVSVAGDLRVGCARTEA